MKEVQVIITQKEHNRLLEIEKVYKEGVCVLYQDYTYGVGSYSHNTITAFNADDGMKNLAEALNEAEDLLSKKKWYQFVELK